MDLDRIFEKREPHFEETAELNIKTTWITTDRYIFDYLDMLDF